MVTIKRYKCKTLAFGKRCTYNCLTKTLMHKHIRNVHFSDLVDVSFEEVDEDEDE